MENDKVLLDTKKLKIWESMSNKIRLYTLIHYMREYNVSTYDNYILLTLAAHGFLKIEYDRHVVDDFVLRHMDKKNILFFGDEINVWEGKFEHSISIVHTMPDNHSMRSLVECAQSHFVNNYTQSHNYYASKFEADFMLSYLMLLIGEKELRENIRKIFLDTYQPESDGALWKIPKEVWNELDLSLPDVVHQDSSGVKRWYGKWEAFAVELLNICHGSVFDVYAGIGTMAMQLDLSNITYTAGKTQSKEFDMMSMLFCTDDRLSDYWGRKQIQLFNEDVLFLKDKKFDFIIYNPYNQERALRYEKRSYHLSHLHFMAIVDMMSKDGRSLIVWENSAFYKINFNQYQCVVESLILLSPNKSIMLLNKNKEHAELIKVYDRTGWEDFTAEQLLESIREQENLHILTLEDINDMGGYFNADVFKRKHYKIGLRAGYKLIRLSDVLRAFCLKDDALDGIPYLHHNIEGYTPLSPYVDASHGSYKPEYEDANYFYITQKLLIVYSLAKDYYRTFIFDPKNGGASVDDNVICFDVDEEKIDIGYLVYQMNEGYFLEQLFPHKGENVYPINSTDILACQILVPDVESSVERQKQIIEDLRQKEIAEIARRYGFDLGKFVQYKASDLLKGTTLNKGKYTVEGVIGHGGFGKVYKARNEETGEVVAIKEFFYHSRQVRDPETNDVRTNFADIGYVDDAKEKFRRERDKIMECAHDNIVKVYEYFEENNTCYYAMEYVDGKNLKGYRNIGEREALAIIRQVAEALKAMHEKRYNHSDVKPQNILLDSNGVATLIDFTGAHHYGDDEMEGLSKTGNSVPMEIKTPGYTPDCAYKAKGFHAGRDIYSLGATLYYMLTGNEPATIDNQAKPAKMSSKSWRAICSAVEEDPRKWLRSMDEFLALLPGDEEIGDMDVPEPTKNLRITPRPVMDLQDDEVFVFGSNLAGHHSGGAAKQALKWGAKWYVASGPMGQTYGIPTVGVHGLDAVERYVSQFIKYVEENDHITFYVTAIGCGSAGFTPEQIAPLFKDCVELPNVYLPESFWRVLRNKGFVEPRVQVSQHS